MKLKIGENLGTVSFYPKFPGSSKKVYSSIFKRSKIMFAMTTRFNWNDRRSRRVFLCFLLGHFSTNECEISDFCL